MNKEETFTIFFAFTKPNNFSGQTAASELIINSLYAGGIKCIPIILYPLARNKKNPILSYFKLFIKQGKIISSLMLLLFSRKPILHLNLGQSFWSFIRIGIWYFPIIVINRNIRVVTSLHGNLFMLWKPNAIITRLFMKFLNTSRVITVLGENQKMKLLKFGLPDYKIRVIPNACFMDPVSDSFIHDKHSNSKGPINLLYLSLLIESKGFAIYLEALEELAKMSLSQPVRAVLCGPITFTPYPERFRTIEEKKKWIEMKVELINRNTQGWLSVEWIPGATGILKQKLFEDSQIFVLPTYFPVEAQPIVLLEALATGCCIITSKAGEISSTLSTESAVFMEKLTPGRLAEEIQRLIINSELRIKMAIAGIELIRGPLSLKSHMGNWDIIFKELKN